MSRAIVNESQSGLVTRLALALGPVRAAVRVVDRSPKPFQVDWAAVGKDEQGRSRSLSFTDFAGGRIRVNPLPLVENRPNATELVTGFGLHEASHCQEGTRDRFAILTEPVPYDRMGANGGVAPVFQPLRIAAYLLNLADDVRVEAATARKWRGFAPYFDAVLDYMWHEPEAIGTKTPSLAAHLRLAWYAIRYGARVHSVRAALETTLPAGLAFDDEVTFWQAWQADYLADAVDVRTSVQRGMDRLAIPPESQKELASLAEAERKEIAAGERLRAQIDRLIREGVEGAPGICVTEDGEFRALTNEEAEAVDALIREGLIAARPILTGQGAHVPDILIRKPVEDEYSRRAYIGHPGALVEALRAALVFRSSAPRHDLKLQERGVMDDEELWRIGTDDFRVFSERIIEARPDTAFGMLVDASGSMHGEKLATAQRLAQSLVWALQDQEGVEARVWAHSTEAGAVIYRIWEPGDPLSRLGIIDTIPHSGNVDGVAIGWCVQQMLPLPQPQKVLIVLSDGLPNHHGYGGPDGMAHVRAVVDWARRQGVEVRQIAIDDDIRPDQQTIMYGEGGYIPYTSDATLPRDLGRLLARMTA